MVHLPETLSVQGFRLQDVTAADLPRYIEIKKACYEKYVDAYFGGWDDAVQVPMNAEQFHDQLRQTCFKKLLFRCETVGYFAYDICRDSIDGISIQMLESARNRGIGSFYMQHVTALSGRLGKPVYLKVFRSNPAQNLYRRFGFDVYDATPTHYLMKFSPKGNE